jgi:hypothetical protein
MNEITNEQKLAISQAKEAIAKAKTRVDRAIWDLGQANRAHERALAAIGKRSSKNDIDVLLDS